jgi:hypothetical protein
MAAPAASAARSSARAATPTAATAARRLGAPRRPPQTHKKGGGDGPLSDYYLDGHGGAGGAGVLAFQSVTVAQTSGTIEGAGGGVYSGRGASGGAGGAGVYLGGGGRIVCGGEIIGGAGGYGAYGGAGGAGVQTRLAATVTNTGTILGGTGGGGSTIAGVAGNGVALSYAGGVVTNGSARAPSALIEGRIGVDLPSYANTPATVTNFGTIEGAGGVSVYFGSHGATGDRVIAESGSTWIGAVVGGGGTLELAGGTGTMAGLGGGGSLAGSVAMDFDGFGAYQIDKASVWTLTGSDTLAAGVTFTDKGKLASTGVLGVFGTVTGPGTLTLGGGATTIESGARVTVNTWSLIGGTADVDETLVYAGTFNEGTGATMTLGSGDKLTVSGADTLAGLVDGAGTLVAADATLKTLTVGGSDTLSLTGSAIQAGKVTIGDATASAATLSIAKGATYTIATPWDIDQGVAAGSSLDVLGDLVRSGASGTTIVQLATTDSGMIEAGAGTLDFTSALTGNGRLSVATGAILEVDSTAASSLALSFTGTNAVLALKDPSAFGASIAGFAPGDDIDLLKIKATSAVLGAGVRW